MSLVSLLAALLEDVRDTGGKEVYARCPMHEQRTGQREHRPDHWSINRTTGLHTCHSCHYSGSLPGLIMDMTGLDRWSALQLIRQHEVETDRGHAVDVAEVVSALKVTKTLEADYVTFSDPPPRALERRRIDLDACAYFGVRWDEDCWILPIRHSRGALWGWQAKFADHVENYPPGVRTSLTLFGLHLLKPGSLAVLVESPLDVLVVHRHGYQGVAAFGTSVSQQQLHLLRERTDRLCVALDNDRAGRDGTYRLLCDRVVHFSDLSVLSYRHSRAKDPGDMSGDELDLALAMAVPATKWLIDPPFA
jgi:DNA primase